MGEVIESDVSNLEPIDTQSNHSNARTDIEDIRDVVLVPPALTKVKALKVENQEGDQRWSQGGHSMERKQMRRVPRCAKERTFSKPERPHDERGPNKQR